MRLGGLLQTEEFLNALFVAAGNCSGVGEVTFLLGGLFGENVALESVLSLDFS